VPHLASHVLGRMAARLSADWEQMYGSLLQNSKSLWKTRYSIESK